MRSIETKIRLLRSELRTLGCAPWDEMDHDRMGEIVEEIRRLEKQQ